MSGRTRNLYSCLLHTILFKDMPGSPNSEVMSSRSSHSPGAEVEEPRKKGSRGGKRSVTHLSKAQLARKRANDREAQRNIRQRTKEHIENLEKKVKELEGTGRSSSMERVLQRNHELEVEIEKLKSRLSSTTSTPSQMPSELSEDSYHAPKNELNWMPETNLGWTSIPNDNQSSMGMASGGYMNSPSSYPATSGAMAYDQELFPPTAIPMWNDSQVFGQNQPPQGNELSKVATWMPFHPTFNQPSRFADLQLSGFRDLLPTLTS